MTKVEPKLKFEVGEEVIICGAHTSWSGNEHWPNENEFTFTTIKEVREDGSVIVEEGYRFKQAYKTQYGFTDIFDYFKIDRSKNNIKFNGKKYCKFRYYQDARIDDGCVFYFGPVYLFKKNKTFDKRITQYVKEYKHDLEVKKQAEEAKAIKDAKEKPFKDAYEEVVKPLKEEYERKLIEAWKEHFCKNCKHNRSGYCCTWGYDIDTNAISNCSDWKLK